MRDNHLLISHTGSLKTTKIGNLNYKAHREQHQAQYHAATVLEVYL